MCKRLHTNLLTHEDSLNAQADLALTGVEAEIKAKTSRSDPEPIEHLVTGRERLNQWSAFSPLCNLATLSFPNPTVRNRIIGTVLCPFSWYRHCLTTCSQKKTALRFRSWGSENTGRNGRPTLCRWKEKGVHLREMVFSAHSLLC